MKPTSKERILDLLRKNRQGLTLQDIFKELGVQRKERAKIESHLLDLEAKKLVRKVRNRWLMPADSDLVRGRFETFGRGFGFVIREGGKGEDVYVPARHAKGAMHGDSVEILARETGGRGGRNEGRVVRILKKERKSIVGVFSERMGAPYIVPFDSSSLEEVPLVSRGSLFPKPGMIVAADRGRLVLTDVFGFPDETGVDTRVLIRKYGLAEEFSEAVLAEAEETASLPRDAAGRADYRGWTTFTIDGEHAQDFDDAVSIRTLDGGRVLLGVHIADVSHYVRPGTALDRSAFERGTSVYFPGLTLPMLPERLSNDVCSLRPREDRLTVSALLEIAPDGSVARSEFHPSIIRTAERLTYTSGFKILEGDAEERARTSALVPDLLAMRDLARRLRARRVGDGSLDFDLLEPELVYQEGRLASITTFAQNEAHKLIEEFMVAANVAVAAHLSRRKVPSIFRVHPPPAAADLEKLRDVLLPFGIILPAPDKVRPGDLQAAIRAAEDKPYGKFVNVQILRAMRMAAYSEKNAGHFGLAQTDYTHFTSPIRRFPDLVVHRTLKAVALDASSLPGLALHCSAQERKADAAEQELVEWRIFRYLKDKLGEEFGGLVVDVSRTGFVVELDDLFVRGHLSFEDLGGPAAAGAPGLTRGSASAALSRDMASRMSAPGSKRRVPAGRKSRPRIELGQSVRVILAAVDPILRRMTLVPA
jgi:ribonuclease R